MKRREQRILEMEIRRQLNGVHIKKPVVLTYSVYEQDRKRDWDNVLSIVMKFTNDALVKVGVLQNDTQRWVVGYGKPTTEVDRSDPRIELIIEEVEDGQD